MKQRLKNIIIPALALLVFVPAITLAANSEFVFPDKGKKEQAQISLQANGESLNLDKTERLATRDARRLANRANRQAMLEVLNSGDYEAWLAFAEDKNCPMISQVNAENFSDFVAAHQARMTDNQQNLNQMKQLRYQQ